MVLRKVFHYAVMSDIYASLIAAGIVLIALAVLGLPLDIFSAAAVFFTALAVYALNRQDDADIDAINVPERTKFVSQRGWLVLSFSIAGFFSLLTYAYMTNGGVFTVMAAIFVLGLFYSFPLLRPLHAVTGFSRLKDVLGVKNALVSAMYGAFVLIPVLNVNAPITPLVGLLFLFVFLRFFIVSTIFDLRDVEGDARKNVNTIPVVFGKEKAVLFLHGLNAITVLAVVAAAAEHAVPALFGSMVFVTFLFATYYIEQCRRENTDIRHLCSVVVEADFVPAAAVALPFLLL
jgi:4-hydroxybenzoate polyprenyltransferase